MKNMVSVDLEDNYCDLDFSTWDKQESRVTKTTNIVLNLLDKYNATATFFTPGYIAQRHPELIEQVKAKGHEIASHSYSHPDLRTLTKEKFEAELVKSLEVLKKVSGEKILGFRAPYFSISRKNFWMFGIMRKHLRYDSSLYPVGLHYGFPEAPRHIYRMSRYNPLEHDPDSDFIEVPMSTIRLPFLGNLPIAGGFYLRVLPLAVIRTGIRKLNDLGHSAMCYIHPEDLAPDRPHITGYAWHYYYGLNDAQRKFESLLKNFKFCSVRESIAL